MTLDLLPHTTYKLSSKWIEDLNIRVKAIKLLEENIGVNLCDPGLSSGFLNMTPKVQTKK